MTPEDLLALRASVEAATAQMAAQLKAKHEGPPDDLYHAKVACADGIRRALRARAKQPQGDTP